MVRNIKTIIEKGQGNKSLDSSVLMREGMDVHREREDFKNQILELKLQNNNLKNDKKTSEMQYQSLKESVAE